MSLLDDFMDWTFDKGLLGLAIFVLAALAFSALLVAAAFSPFIIYDAVQPRFSLRKDEWRCTASHTETVAGGYFVGRVWVPTTNTIAVCDQWSRR